ncbi:MAG: undecaprenyl-diphosphate phosphatase [Candidatus Magasanikbacteria bacterium]|nr:undecaprenyl-diphosphate phosphatase [Candidatus Magasanikbacteria bacterium]
MTTFFQAFFLGILQGVAEFLPISSSGHLILLSNWLNWSDQGLFFDVVLHLGSLLAVVFYFRKKLLSLLFSIFGKTEDNKEERRFIFLLAISTLPAVLVGFLIKDFVENSLRSVLVVAFGLIFWGGVLWFADWKSRHHKTQKTHNDLNWKDTLFIGFAQAIALIPGTSRSGITISAGLLKGMNRKDAASFSFLMSIPVIFGAGLLTFLDITKSSLETISVSHLFVGFISAFVSGFFAICFLMRFIQKRTFKDFAIYRFVLGALILILYFV